MSRKRKNEASGRNAQTTSGQQESRDTGSGSEAHGGDVPAPVRPGRTRRRQAYDRGGRAARDFKRAGQIHADVQDRTE